MTPHVDESLPALALGTLPDVERAAVEKHLAGCGRCAVELMAVRELLSSLALDTAPIAPAAGARNRLLDEARSGRLHRFADKVAALLGIAVESARGWLDRLDEPGAWTPLQIPGAGGISYLFPDRAPRLEGCAVAFLRIKPGAQFPLHGHLAGEQVLILQGGYVDDQTGVEYGPGDVHVCEAGSSHSYTGVEGPDCLCLGVVEGRIKVGDVEIG